MPTSKKYLSVKKTAQQTISISPALKDWIERYVRVNKKSHPKDQRFKSISSFYTYILEKSMEILNYGKTLDDFQIFVDHQTEGFFEKLTFRAFIPLHEECVRSHRYNDLRVKEFTRFLFLIRNRYIEGVEPYDYIEIQKRFEILRNFYLENKVVKDIHLEIMNDGDRKYPKGIFYWTGNYRNLFWENCKMNAAVFGILGVKITEVIYSEKDLYCRFNLKATDLIFNTEKLRNQRIELVEYNVNKLLNRRQIINDDDDFYIWMKMAEDRDIHIKFYNDKIRDEWIEKTMKDIENLIEKKEVIPSILKFFSKLHWIDIEDMTSKCFKIRLSKENDNKEIAYVLNVLSKYSKIIKTENMFYLEE